MAKLLAISHISFFNFTNLVLKDNFYRLSIAFTAFLLRNRNTCESICTTCVSDVVFLWNQLTMILKPTHFSR